MFHPKETTSPFLEIIITKHYLALWGYSPNYYLSVVCLEIDGEKLQKTDQSERLLFFLLPLGFIPPCFEIFSLQIGPATKPVL